MSESAWHWDEQRALRTLLAEQAERHAGELAALQARAELAELRAARLALLLVFSRRSRG